MYARPMTGPLAADSSCLNCGESLRRAHCEGCGQAASIGRLQVREIVGDAVSHLFSLDSKVPRTVVGLTLDPGRVVREYVEGRRATYVSPLRYCLIAVAVMVLVYVSLDINVVNLTVTSTSPDVEVQRQVDEIRLKIIRVINARLNLVIFLALPLLGLAVRWLFRRSRRNYAECMAYVLYVMGQVFLLGIPFGLLHSASPKASISLRVLLQIGYLTWAATGFFGGKWWISALKVVLATFMYMLAVTLAVAALAGPRALELLRQGNLTP